MMKKVLMILAVLLLVTVPVGVFAANSDSEVAENFRGFCGFGLGTDNLTEQQQADVNDSFNQMIELRKASISTFVADGLMTQEEADAALARLDEMVEHHEDDSYGMMGGYGRGGMMGGFGRGGMMDDYFDGDED
ncbi:MAG: hypothetical protein PWR12_1682 [Eubacteriaceae bacterium]|jgi:competence protein ComGC|nr:hypothetical protein [Eubacteriaceae bacterium]MDK2935036.1 hypothetical protein [Eubacteriaceae bacterium]